MPINLDAVGSTPRKVAETVNASLNFVLAGYVDAKAMPGVTPTRQQAVAAMKAMRQRARLESLLVGAGGTDAADEGLSKSLEELGRSRITERYVATGKGVRPYVNSVIRRKVWAAAFTLRVKTTPALDERMSHENGPDSAVEIRDLAEACAARLQGTPTIDYTPRSGESASARYTRIHRQRKAIWAAISPLFPGVTFKPRRNVSRKAMG